MEHVQHLAGLESLAAMRAAGVVAVTNPLHLVPDLEVVQAALGRERSRSDHAFPSSALLKVPCPTSIADALSSGHTAAMLHGDQRFKLCC